MTARNGSRIEAPAANLLAPMRAPLEPIAVRAVADEIADRLATAIILGEYISGQRLPAERDLARLLGVSRATVREALERLASAGYLDIRRGRNGGDVRRTAGSRSADSPPRMHQARPPRLRR